MEFTGERIVPGSVNADLLNEHLCRYRFAQLLVEDKVVLDIGSGVGYGSKILAEKASAVLAVDRSEEAVRYAREEYAGENVEMVVGDGHDLPLAGHSVDVVVSFELIEHLRSQKAHLRELDRVLKPGGLTVISTPNRIFYSQESNQANPFHTHEFDFQEFLTFLKSVFSSVQIYFQNHIAGLIVGNPSLSQEVTTCLQEGVGDLETTANYFVAVCTHGRKNQPRLGNFCLLPSSGNLLRERQQNIQRLEEEVGKLDRALTRLQDEYKERTRWALQLDQRVRRKDASLLRLREEFEDRSRWAEELSRRLKERDKAQLKLQSEFEDRTEWALRLDAEVERLDAEVERLDAELQKARLKLEAIKQSRLYKLARLLGLRLKA